MDEQVFKIFVAGAVFGGVFVTIGFGLCIALTAVVMKRMPSDGTRKDE